MPVFAGLHNFAEEPDLDPLESDPDQHQSKISDPRQNERSDPDLYQSVMSDPDPHRSGKLDPHELFLEWNCPYFQYKLNLYQVTALSKRKIMFY
jgi:hypothetical protein